MKVACSALSASFLITLVAGFIDQSPPFDVKFYDSHLPQTIVNQLLGPENGKNASQKSYERLYISTDKTASEGSKNDQFLCEFHPENEIMQDVRPEDQDRQESESPAAILDKAVALIHSSIPQNACLWAYDLRGMYWTYALCSADKIIQYHEGASPEDRGKKHVPQQPSTVFVLGRFSKASAHELAFENQASESEYLAYVKAAGRSATLVDEKSAPFSHHSAQKAVSQIVTDGSLCDMTLQPRTVEVVYRCGINGGPAAAISDVSEIKTCHYKMYVHVPELCEYEPFSPHKTSADAAVEVQCQRVSDPEEDLKPKFGTFDEYTQNTVLRAHDQFPVRADNRIDLADHYLAPLGRGFFFARSKREFHTSSTYFSKRNVVLFSGTYASPTDLNAQFAKVIFRSIGTSLLAPGPQEEGPKTLSWPHSFILWYEIYDYKGELLGLTRLEHDASEESATLKAQLLDPVTLLDVEGDMPSMVRFEKPDFEAPHDMWNFQVFSEEGAAVSPRKGDGVQGRHNDENAEGRDEYRGRRKHRKPHEYPKARDDQKPHNNEHSSEQKISSGNTKIDESRPILAFNRGVQEDSRIMMELVDQSTGRVLSGGYDAHGNYVFEIEDESGYKHSFTIKPLDSSQDFVGFTVKVPSESNVSRDTMKDTIVNVDSESVDEDQTHDGDSSQSEQKVRGEDAKEDNDISGIQIEDTANKYASTDNEGIEIGDPDSHPDQQPQKPMKEEHNIILNHLMDEL